MRGITMRFDDIKTETLNLRVAPSFKRALKVAAAAESRSMVNLLEVILIDYCERRGLAEAASAPTQPFQPTDSETGY